MYTPKLLYKNIIIFGGGGAIDWFYEALNDLTLKLRNF